MRGRNNFCGALAFGWCKAIEPLCDPLQRLRIGRNASRQLEAALDSRAGLTLKSDFDTVNSMVNQINPELSATFAALSDPTRRAILDRLGKHPYTVSELAEPFPISLPAISKHLRVLERAGLISREREGRTQVCRLRAEPMRRASEWLERYRTFWESRLEALEAHLKGDQPN